MNLSEKYEFRSIRREEAEQVAELEQICFPPAEAISREDIIDRVKKIPELFYQAIREICKIGSGCSSQRGSSKPWKRKASLDPTIYILLYVIEYEGVAITVFH